MKIMAAAFQLFADKGNEFSLNEVANEVGIQKASIYAHFTNKEDLMYSVINNEINTYFLEINKNSQDLKSMFFMLLNYYEKSIAKLYFWKRLLLFPPKAFEETLIAKIKNLSQQRFELIKEIIVSDMDNGSIRRQDPETVAFAYLSMIHGILSNVIIYKLENLTKHYEGTLEIFLNGIK